MKQISTLIILAFQQLRANKLNYWQLVISCHDSKAEVQFSVPILKWTWFFSKKKKSLIQQF